MSKPLDFFGNPISVGDTVIYAGGGYNLFRKMVVTAVNHMTVDLGEPSPLGWTRRRFNGVIVVDAIEAGGDRTGPQPDAEAWEYLKSTGVVYE